MANSTRNHPSSSAHRALQTSTTLSRRYVKRPVAVTQPANLSVVQKIAEATSLTPTENSPLSSPRDIALRRRQAIAAKINRERINSMRRGYLAAKSSSVSKSASAAAKLPAPKTEQKTNLATPANSNSSSQSTVNQAKSTIKTIAVKTEQKPNKIKPSPASSKLKIEPKTTSTPKPHPYEAIVRSRLQAKKTEKNLPTAKELKDKAINDALRSVATMSEKDALKTKNPKQRFFQGRRALLAFGCALASVSALGYFVHRNFPDISVRVTAMQAGFDVRYPSFIPEGYHISGITSEKPAKVTMKFTNDKHHFTISEERSAWDSQSLLHNFVKPNWNDQYTTAREQGITVFLSGKTSACWVNGGVLYKITTSGHLDKLQLHNIIHSL